MAGAPDVVVVGGGVIGCALAYELARSGAQVTVLERERVGAGASSAAAGMLAPLAEAHEGGAFLALGLESLRLFPALVTEIEQDSGIAVDFNRCGILRIAMTPAVEAALRKGAAERPDDVSVVEPAKLRQLEPCLAQQVLLGVLSPQEAQVSAPRFVQALAGAAAARGARLREGEQVVGLVRQGERVTGVATTREKLAAGHVVLTAGAWTGALMGQLTGKPAPIFPRRGQVISVAAPRPPLRHIVFGEGGYLTPKSDGSIIVGATDEDAGFDISNTVEGVRGMLDYARRTVPALASAPIRAMWAGLRPGSGDGHPLLGPVPGAEGLWMASGHYRNGVLLAPVTGKLMAEWLLAGKASMLLAPFSAARLATAHS